MNNWLNWYFNMQVKFYSFSRVTQFETQKFTKIINKEGQSLVINKVLASENPELLTYSVKFKYKGNTGISSVKLIEKTDSGVYKLEVNTNFDKNLDELKKIVFLEERHFKNLTSKHHFNSENECLTTKKNPRVTYYYEHSSAVNSINKNFFDIGTTHLGTIVSSNKYLNGKNQYSSGKVIYALPSNKDNYQEVKENNGIYKIENPQVYINYKDDSRENYKNFLIKKLESGRGEENNSIYTGSLSNINDINDKKDE